MEKGDEYLLNLFASMTGLQNTDTLSLDFCKKVFFCIGFWPATMTTEPSGLQRLVRKYLPRFVLGMNYYASFLAEPLLIYLTFGDDLQFSMHLISSLTVAWLVFITLTCLQYRRQQIADMFDAMEAMKVASSKLPLLPADILDRNSRMSRWPLVYILGCFVGVLLSFLGLPDLYRRREFVYFQWYPFDEKSTPGHQIAFVLTFVGHCCALTCLALFVAMFFSLLIEAVGNLRLLSYNLSQITSRRKTIAGGPILTDNLPLRAGCEDEALSTNLGRDKGSFNVARDDSEEKLKDALQICVQLHCTILRFIKEVTCTFDAFIFHFLLCALVPTAMGIVALIYAEEVNDRIIITFCFVLGCDLGTAVCCWLANQISEESEAVREAVYDCDWFDQSESFKRSMRIIMSLSNQPLVVRVAGFVPLSMETFYSMSKITYSYCMAMWTEYKERKVI